MFMYFSVLVSLFIGTSAIALRDHLSEMIYYVSNDVRLLLIHSLLIVSVVYRMVIWFRFL